MLNVCVGIQTDCIFELVEKVLRAQPFIRDRSHAFNRGLACKFKSVWIPDDCGIAITLEYLSSILDNQPTTQILDVSTKKHSRIELYSIPTRLSSIKASQNLLKLDNTNGIHIKGRDVGT
jgi:hypothetical protein